MLKRIVPPLIMMDLVYPVIRCTMHKRSSSDMIFIKFTGFVYRIGILDCVSLEFKPFIAIIFCFGYLCNLSGFGLKTHEPFRSFVQLSLSEIR
jgi:hypothetical protein